MTIKYKDFDARKKSKYKNWLRQANFDLEAAKLSLNNGYFEWACFQAEQSAEKALKGVISYFGEKPPKMHKLSILYHFAKKLHPDIEGIEGHIQILQAYTFVSRYPFVIPGDNLSPHDFITSQNGEECVNEAKVVYDSISKLLQFSNVE